MLNAVIIISIIIIIGFVTFYILHNKRNTLIIVKNNGLSCIV